MKADIFGDLGEEPLFLFIRDVSVFYGNLGQRSTSMGADSTSQSNFVLQASEGDNCVCL